MVERVCCCSPTVCVFSCPCEVTPEKHTFGKSSNRRKTKQGMQRNFGTQICHFSRGRGRTSSREGESNGKWNWSHCGRADLPMVAIFSLLCLRRVLPFSVAYSKWTCVCHVWFCRFAELTCIAMKVQACWKRYPSPVFSHKLKISFLVSTTPLVRLCAWNAPPPIDANVQFELISLP